MGQCFYKGVFYSQGTTFPQGDGCNTCVCNLGQLVTCTDVDCPPPVDSCQHGTRILMAGETFILETQFLCYNCTCTLGGMVTCLPVDCTVSSSTTETTTTTSSTTTRMTTTATTTIGRYYWSIQCAKKVDFQTELLQTELLHLNLLSSRLINRNHTKLIYLLILLPTKGGETVCTTEEFILSAVSFQKEMGAILVLVAWEDP